MCVMWEWRSSCPRVPAGLSSRRGSLLNLPLLYPDEPRHSFPFTICPTRSREFGCFWLAAYSIRVEL